MFRTIWGNHIKDATGESPTAFARIEGMIKRKSFSAKEMVECRCIHKPSVPFLKKPFELLMRCIKKGNASMRVRDETGEIYDDHAFVLLFPKCGQPAEAPWRLLLISVMQFAEGLLDRQAADAVRGRLDWKYIALAQFTSLFSPF